MITTFYLATLRGRARLALAIAAIVAVLALAGAAPASAAPPALNASENPVIIPPNTSHEAITLAWNLNGYQGGVLVLNVQENGGPIVLSQPVSAQKGTASLTVSYPKSYTATLSDLAAGPLTSLAIATRRVGLVNDFDARATITDCVLNPCITSVAFDPHGSWSDFRVKTTKPAKFGMAICGQAFNANGSCDRPVSGMFNLQLVGEWKSHVTGLTHNMSYHYLVTATDQEGNDETRRGTFRTLRRKVEVKVDEIAVTNDSDDLSECDCSFVFEVDDKRDYWPGNTNGVSIGTGETVNPPLAVTVLDAPDTLRMRLFGRDNDKTGSVFQSCGGGTPDLGWGAGTNACWAWATATETFNVAATGFGEEIGGSFYKRAEDSTLTFRVLVSYTVTYVP
jgi:hypothetical protein